MHDPKSVRFLLTQCYLLSVLALQVIKYGGWHFDIFAAIKSRFGGGSSAPAADDKAAPS